MNNFTTVEKYAILHILSSIMKADGIINPKEEEYMNQVYRAFSTTIQDLEEISDFDDILAKHIIKRMRNENKKLARTIFTDMAKADGFIHPKEIEVIDQMFACE